MHDNRPQQIVARVSALVLLACGATLAMAGCGAEAGDAGYSFQGGSDESLRGELMVFIADGIGGKSETRYLLRTPSGQEHALVFDHQVDLAPGSQVALRGSPSPRGFQVASVDVVAGRTGSFDSPARETLARQSSALIEGAAYAPRSFAFVMVDLGGGINITADGALGSLISDADSLRNYYQAASYGRQDISAQVFGPINYLLTSCTTMDTSAMARALRPMIEGTFQHYLWYFGSRRSDCGWTGLASVGTAGTPSRDTWYNASTNCTVLVQEPGHNFGMQHSSSLSCPGVSFADDPNTCTADEYGDIYDPMGNACRHMNAWQKSYQGWFGGCNGVAVTASGRFTLLPLERRCEGAQFLKISAAKARSFDRPAGGGGASSIEAMTHFYVELRTPLDFDGTVGNRSALTPQILIHVGDDTKDRTEKGVHTYLLDMNPQTVGRAAFVDAALKVGATFTDPAGGVSITAVSVGAAQATIDVQITGGVGGPLCLDGSPFAAPGPGPESCGGGAAGSAGSAGSVGSAGSAGSNGSEGSGGASGGASGPGRGAGGAGDGGCACALVRARADGRSGQRIGGAGALFFVIALGMALTRRRR